MDIVRGRSVSPLCVPRRMGRHSLGRACPSVSCCLHGGKGHRLVLFLQYKGSHRTMSPICRKFVRSPATCDCLVPKFLRLLRRGFDGYTVDPSGGGELQIVAKGGRVSHYSPCTMQCHGSSLWTYWLETYVATTAQRLSISICVLQFASFCAVEPSPQRTDCVLVKLSYGDAV